MMIRVFLKYNDLFVSGFSIVTPFSYSDMVLRKREIHQNGNNTKE